MCLIAVIVLAVLRHDQRPADMAGGNDVSPTTVRRWMGEVIELVDPHLLTVTASIASTDPRPATRRLPVTRIHVA